MQSSLTWLAFGQSRRSSTPVSTFFTEIGRIFQNDIETQEGDFRKVPREAWPRTPQRLAPSALVVSGSITIDPRGPS